jgi:hypothetical protein
LAITRTGISFPSLLTLPNNNELFNGVDYQERYILLSAFNKYQTLDPKEKVSVCNDMEYFCNERFQDKPIAQAFCQGFIERVKLELKQRI